MKDKIIKAVKAGNIQEVKELILQGVDVDTLDEFENPIIFWAAVRGYPKLVRFLIEAGANIDFRDGDDRTLLHHVAAISFIAPSLNQNKVAEILIEAGANINAQAKVGTRPHNIITFN